MNWYLFREKKQKHVTLAEDFRVFLLHMSSVLHYSLMLSFVMIQMTCVFSSEVSHSWSVPCKSPPYCIPYWLSYIANSKLLPKKAIAKGIVSSNWWVRWWYAAPICLKQPLIGDHILQFDSCCRFVALPLFRLLSVCYCFQNPLHYNILQQQQPPS